MRFTSTFPVNREVLCAVMSTVYYFDIFKHPLQEKEILELAHHRIVSADELAMALSFLVANSFLKEKNGYYLPDSSYDNISRRIAGFTQSEKYWEQARKKSKLISHFPFTRCVLISGSLSKGYMDDQSDIDYLIITKPGRLWIARTLLVLYKKIFLLNSHKFFCVNYFLDQNHLLLNDRNLFTATELLFAKPAYNEALYLNFMKVNPWAQDFYPSIKIKAYPGAVAEVKNSAFKNLLEYFLNGKLGDYLDKQCMKISDKFWNRKFRKMSREQFERDMKSDKGVSKHHPNGFRDRILTEHQQKMDLFISRLNDLSEIKTAQSQPVYQS